MARIDVLRASLEKKEAEFDASLQRHFADVMAANGQPLNDKRNGRKTIDRWDRQNDALISKKESIEKTKAAIEREERALSRVAEAVFPACVQELIDAGELTVWRKFPTYVFVQGVEKARIQYKNGKLYASYFNSLSPEQYAKFRDLFNGLSAKVREENSNG